MASAFRSAAVGSVLLHVAVFSVALAWGFQIGDEVAGMALGALMGVNAGVFAVIVLSGLQGWIGRLRRPGVAKDA